jgi:hypothetical protein
MLLATANSYTRLLGSYRNLNLGCFADSFSIGIYSYKDVAYLLDIAKNKKDTVPIDNTN